MLSSIRDTSLGLRRCVSDAFFIVIARLKAFYTKFPLNALTNLLTESFVERGGRRRQAGACQGGQRSYTEFNAINVKVF